MRGARPESPGQDLSPLIVKRAMDCIREACLSVCFMTLAVGTCYLWIQSIHSIIASEACRFVHDVAAGTQSPLYHGSLITQWTVGSFIQDATTTFNKTRAFDHSTERRKLFQHMAHASTDSIPRHGAITSQLLSIPEAWLYRPFDVQTCSILQRLDFIDLDYSILIYTHPLTRRATK